MGTIHAADLLLGKGSGHFPRYHGLYKAVFGQHHVTAIVDLKPVRHFHQFFGTLHGSLPAQLAQNLGKLLFYSVSTSRIQQAGPTSAV